MIIKEVRFQRIGKIFSLVVMSILIISFVSAGVGIKWERESALVDEKEEACLTYKVYNPWPKESYVAIMLSDELEEVLTIQEAETKFIPANTASKEAIPVKFCFKAPVVYEKDCWIFDKLICKRDCNEEQKVYEGEVIIKSVPPPADAEGTGGSVTTMSVSAPLRIKIRCIAYSRNFMLIYIAVAAISLLIIPSPFI